MLKDQPFEGNEYAIGSQVMHNTFTGLSSPDDSETLYSIQDKCVLNRHEVRNLLDLVDGFLCYNLRTLLDSI